jgi:hypothetical protein
MRAPITDIKVHLGMKPDQYPLRSRVPTSPRVLGIGLKVTEPNPSVEIETIASGDSDGLLASDD